jgi:nicotinamidase/pyrazinamidase
MERAEAAAVKEGGRVLILIDIQNDFHPGGSLAIANADQDSKRVASLIRRSIQSSSGSSTRIDRIICTMDSHNTLHIANPGFWISGEDYTSKGGATMVHPSPFTVITSEDVKSKKWIPRPDLKITHDMLNLLGHIHPFHPHVNE